MHNPLSADSVLIFDAVSQHWLLFENPRQVLTTHNLKDALPLLQQIESEVNTGQLYAAGFLSYEAASAFDAALCTHPPGEFPLLWFGIYDAPISFSFPDQIQGKIEPLNWQADISETQYRQAFQKIKRHIRDGDTYQVNYTFRLKAPFSGDPWNLFVRLVRGQGNGFAAYINTDDWAICSASPELFFTLDGETSLSRPMKGTAPRGLWLANDRQQALWLANSQKNRAENVMIVDMVRNDMGRIARIGSIAVTNLFAVEKYPTVWQMTSTVRCLTTASLLEIFRALFPAASITGAPKVRTTRIIAELENSPRNIYTGSIGFMSPGRQAQFNVAIRTVLIDKKNQTAEYGVGGGIVWESDSAGEFQECRTKAQILFQEQPEFDLLETILWTPDEGYFLLNYHLQRLRESAEYFSFEIDISHICTRLRMAEQNFSRYPQRVRLGVSPSGQARIETTRLKPFPVPYRIRLAKEPINRENRFLYHKTTHRQVYEAALRQAPGYTDVLLWNEQGEVTESCIANIVVEKNGQFITPPIESGLLPGTYRQWMLKQGKIVEDRLTLSDLQKCNKIYLINAVRGMWEIKMDW